MFSLGQIRQSIGAWYARYQKTSLFIISLMVVYGFFHFGLEPSSWIVVIWRFCTVAVLLLLLFSPLISKPVRDSETGEKKLERQDEHGGRVVLPDPHGNNIDTVQKLSDTLYLKSRLDTEKDFTVFMSKMLAIIKETFAAQTAAVFLFHQDTNELALKNIVSDMSHVEIGTSFGSERGVLGKVVESGASYFTNEIHNPPEQLLYYNDSIPVTCAIASPVIVDEEIIGILVVDSSEKNAFGAEDINLVESYGSVIAEIIVNYNNLFEFEHSARLFSSFYEVSRGLNSSLQFDEILDLLIGILKQIYRYDRITIVKGRTGEDSGEIIRVVGQIDNYPEGKEFPLNEGLNGWVIRKKRAFRVADMEKGDYFMPRYTKLEKTNYELRSYLAVPISYHDHCFGAVSIEHRKPHMYSERHERILVMLANNFSVALERCHVLSQLESLATTDGLTHLYNYRSFSIRLSEEIERSLRYKLKFSLLILDLDHFKKVNDTYGHLAGDLVLKKVAEEIKLSTRTIDYIARYGGEEFAVILIESDIEDALVIAERIRKNIEALKMTYNDDSVSITISIGGVEFKGSPRMPQELIECADKALYKAKMNGRNRIETYTEKETESVVNEKP